MPSASLREFDVCLMQGHSGRHIGILVEANGKLGMLHANGFYPQGGSVMWQPIYEVARDGYHSLRYWRHQP
jgi:hypothetical protein